MNRLKHHFCYLSGPMDEVPDLGVDWRLHMQEFLWGHDIGVLNPCDKPTDIAKEDVALRNNINQWKEEKKWDMVSKSMKPIVNIDLGMVDMCHFVILNIDKDYHMCGSYGEQTTASLQRKPVLVYCKQGVKHIPNWLFGILDWEYFFDDLTELQDEIEHTCYNKVFQDITDNKWQFFNFDKIYGRKEIHDIL